mgnify:FL=1
MYKIRFNLGRGVNYKKWKIINPDKSVTILDPNEYDLLLLNVKFYNNKKSSLEIYNGANKRVCSWIEAEEILTQVSSIPKLVELNDSNQIRYNPREAPYWVFKEENFDGKKLESVITSKNRVYVL